MILIYILGVIRGRKSFTIGKGGVVGGGWVRDGVGGIWERVGLESRSFCWIFDIVSFWDIG